MPWSLTTKQYREDKTADIYAENLWIDVCVILANGHKYLDVCVCFIGLDA